MDVLKSVVHYYFLLIMSRVKFTTKKGVKVSFLAKTRNIKKKRKIRCPQCSELINRLPCEFCKFTKKRKLLTISDKYVHFLYCNICKLTRQYTSYKTKTDIYCKQCGHIMFIKRIIRSTGKK